MDSSPSPRSIHLLLVESNPADSYLMVEGLRRAGIGEVTVLDDSEQALAYLGVQNASEKSLPDVIFLDLNLTPMTGLELLRRIRADPKLNPIPVIIMSGSQNADDVRRAYQLSANCYITKPNSLDDFLSIMKISYEFWSKVVTLPPR